MLNKNHKVKDDLHRGATRKELKFAFYFRNFRHCQANSIILKKEIEEMLRKEKSAKKINEKIEKFAKTLHALKVNRSHLMELSVKLGTEFRQKIAVRINTMKTLYAIDLNKEERKDIPDEEDAQGNTLVTNKKGENVAISQEKVSDEKKDEDKGNDVEMENAED